MKKIGSLFLAVCLMLSMMTGIAASAEEVLSVVDWNADGDFITINFSHAVSSLEGKVTLTRTNGTTTQNLTEGLTFAGNHALAPTDNLKYNTCIIKPEGGLDTYEDGDAEKWIYTLTLTDVDSSATGVEALSSYRKSFYVELINDDMTLREDKATANLSASNEPMIKSSSMASHRVYTNNSDGEIVVQNVAPSSPGSTTLYYHHPLYNYMHKTVTGSETKYNRAGDYNQTDYTMKAVVKFDLSDITATNSNQYLQINLSAGYNSYDNGGSQQPLDVMRNNGVTGLMQIQLSKNTAEFRIRQGDGSASASTATSLASVTGISTKNNEDLPNFGDGSAVSFKLAAKGGRAVYFLNDKKLLDAAVTQPYNSIGSPAIAVGLRVAGNATNNAFTPGTYDVATITEYEVTLAVECYEPFVDKTEDIEIEDDTIEITLPMEVSEEDRNASYITLLHKGEAVDAEKYSVDFVDGTIVQLTTNGLDNRAVYQIAFDKALYSALTGKFDILGCGFETIPADFELQYVAAYDGEGNPVDLAELGEGDVLKAKAVVNNNYCEETKSFTATVCVYNDKGQLVAIAGDAYELEIGESTGEITATVTCEADTKYSIKCFVWDSLTGMSTLFEGAAE